MTMPTNAEKVQNMGPQMTEIESWGQLQQMNKELCPKVQIPNPSKAIPMRWQASIMLPRLLLLLGQDCSLGWKVCARIIFQMLAKGQNHSPLKATTPRRLAVDSRLRLLVWVSTSPAAPFKTEAIIRQLTAPMAWTLLTSSLLMTACPTMASICTCAICGRVRPRFISCSKTTKLNMPTKKQRTALATIIRPQHLNCCSINIILY